MRKKIGRGSWEKAILLKTLNYLYFKRSTWSVSELFKSTKLMINWNTNWSNLYQFRNDRPKLLWLDKRGRMCAQTRSHEHEIRCEARLSSGVSLLSFSYKWRLNIIRRAHQNEMLICLFTYQILDKKINARQRNKIVRIKS